jgi:hypothetical protein
MTHVIERGSPHCAEYNALAKEQGSLNNVVDA